MSTIPASKARLNIGEVLKALREEFPDITISKIRFLEAEGLIEPERTPSGYRKFGPNDVARLRYILRLQRDQFMPLKVIRQRLEHFDAQTSMEPNGSEAPVEAEPEEGAGEADMMGVGLQLSFEELVSSSGLSAASVRELEGYGLLDPQAVNGTRVYDESDLMVARIARDFGKYGIEARHLKMYRLFTDRESALFQQVLVPLSRSTATTGKRQMLQSLTELARLSKRLKELLLRASMKDHLGG